MKIETSRILTRLKENMDGNVVITAREKEARDYLIRHKVRKLGEGLVTKSCIIIC